MAVIEAQGTLPVNAQDIIAIWFFSAVELDGGGVVSATSKPG